MFQPPAVQGRCEAFLDATSLHRVYHHPRKQASIPLAVEAPPCCLPPRNSTGRKRLYPRKSIVDPPFPGACASPRYVPTINPPLGHPPPLSSARRNVNEATELEPSKEGTKTDTQTHLSCPNKGWKGYRGMSGAKWRTISWKWFPP